MSNQETSSDSNVLDRYLERARKVAPRVVAVAGLASALLSSSSDEARAEAADRLVDEAPAAATELSDQVASARRNLKELGVRVADADTAGVERYRYEDNPRLTPSGREGQTLVFNLTGNWMVAVDEKGEPTFLPEEFDQLDFVVMGSLQERYQDREGEVTAETLRQDPTRLKLAGSYSEEARRKLVKMVRVRLGIPTEGAEELDLEREDDPGVLKRRGEEAKDIPVEILKDVSRDVLRDLRYDLKDVVKEGIKGMLR